ncbi:MAG: biosynthetic-type acetolactate synthase large subunit [Spirochaetaceae bacterium]
MKGAEIFVEALRREKVDTLFCYNGGAVIPIFDALHQHGGGINLIHPRHEQGGTHAADGYARSTGKPGVMLVTSGPGSTNTITGIATAYMDSVPLVVFTGQVPTTMIGTDGFQETDTVGITMPITKANFLVKHTEDLAPTIKKAFYLATTGRPGPVVVDIPKDVQVKEADFVYPDTLDLPGYKPKSTGHPKQVKALKAALKKASKPLVLSGGGVVFSDVTDELNRFLDRFGIPVIHTLMGHGVCPEREELYYGPIGMHGSLYGNYAIQNCDLLIAFGTRFSDRIVGEVTGFAQKAKIVHVDIDAAEIGKNVGVDIPIVGPLHNVLEELQKEKEYGSYEKWVEELVQVKAKQPLKYKTTELLKPQYLIQLANRFFPENTIVSSDVGQNQMWVAQYFRFRRPRRFLTSGGLGTMGYGLPAAVGAAVGNPESQVLAVAGDGGFQMTMQEMLTVRRYGLRVKILLLDNSFLGMVRQWQELLFEKRYAGTEMNDNPDFCKLAEAMGIPSRQLSKVEDAETVMKEFAEKEGSMLLHGIIDKGENVLPMVPAGKSLDNVLEEF